MTELIYKVGDSYFTTYAQALAHKDATREKLTMIFRPVPEYTPEQERAFKEHAKKAAEYHKKEG